MIQKRSIALYIVLSVVTCGIYGIYWFICLNDETNKVSNEQNPTSSGIAILLCIVTCGIYGVYWAYKQGEKLDRASEMYGRPKSDRALIYLLFNLFGLGIVSFALMQDDLNALADPYNACCQQNPYQYHRRPAGSWRWAAQ